MGISAAITFATSIWKGEDIDVAIKNATYSGLKVGGTAFITCVLASQLSKAGLNSALVASSDKKQFANNIIVPIIEKEVSKRQKIKMPTKEQMGLGLRVVLEEIADNMA